MIKTGTSDADCRWRQLTLRTPTTSSATAMIQTTATKNPIEQRRVRMVGCSPVVENMSTRMAAAVPAIAVASNSHTLFSVSPGPNVQTLAAVYRS